MNARVRLWQRTRRRLEERWSAFTSRNRQRIATAIYAGLATLSYFTAYILRFDGHIPAHFVQLLGLSLGPMLLVRLTIYRAFKLSRERWRYVGTRDVARLVAAITNGSAVLLLMNIAAPHNWHVPLSVVTIEAILTCWSTAAVWVLYRMRFEHLMRQTYRGMPVRRVLVVGAGEAGNMLVREMLRFPTGYVPVGFVDDEPTMWGASVQGLEVIGATGDISAIAKAEKADEVIIAIPSAEPATLRRVVTACEETGLHFKVLPGIREVLAGNVSMKQLRDVRIEDLLGREPIQLELPELAADLKGRAVLVTGAAGSIGSELCRQVALHDPSVLVLFDQAETDLFYMELELREKFPDVHIVPVVGDIVDAPGVDRIFAKYAPSRVFHAAAYKHVPMMQHNPREAIRNNVVGTWRIAEAAGRYGVEKFVLVSTDKAVRPANTMGATKRLAELIVLELQSRFPNTAYGAVRFGNVLGSNGSVLPVFRRQMQAGRPLTVTHPETTRYFMTIQEASQLILQSSLLPELRGHIAMLEMGEPVRITDLALNLLRLTGNQNARKNIVFTGLRPGEKLHEELSAPDEEASETSVAKVRILKTTLGQVGKISARVLEWDAAVRDGADDDVIHSFAEMFPGLSGFEQAAPPRVEPQAPAPAAVEVVHA